MKMPTDPQEVKNMMGPFKATNEADKKKFLKEEPEIYSIDPGDHYSLKQRIDLFQGNLETMLDVIEAKLQRVWYRERYHFFLCTSKVKKWSAMKM